jgi:hypothetical protein
MVCFLDKKNYYLPKLLPLYSPKKMYLFTNKYTRHKKRGDFSPLFK